MIPSPHNLRRLTSTDILGLIEASVCESDNLDYKRELPAKKIQQANEDFVKDVCAMANSHGGVILFGVEEEAPAHGRRSGRPIRIRPIADNAIDSEKNRLVNVLASNSDPPVHRVEFATIAVEGGSVLALAVWPSVFGPHALKGGGSRSYWRRVDTANQNMSTLDLRTYVLGQERWLDEVEEFRTARLSPWRELTDPLRRGRVENAFVHLLPLGRLRKRVDLVGSMQHLFEAATGNGSHDGVRPCLDGMRVDLAGGATRITWFRNGGLELRARGYFNHSGGGVEFDAAEFGRMALPLLRNHAVLMSRVLNIDYPFVLLLSILARVPIRLVEHSGLRDGSADHRFDGSEALLEGHLLDGDEAEQEEQLLVAFDELWQAAGVQSCSLRGIPGIVTPTPYFSKFLT